MRKKKILIIAGIVFLVLFGRLLFEAIKLSPVLLELLTKKDIELKKANSHINILLLGIGGGSHQGPNLTDSVIFASIDPKTHKITLVSIPRDLWVPELGAKINTAYAFGEEKEKGGGLTLIKAVVSSILAQPVNYAIRLDFNGFVTAVDLIGGIDITVDKTFDDYEYPVEGKEDDACGKTPEEVDLLATSSSQLDAFPCRYTHVRFNAGSQHMDGKTALMFVRSRHALGEEGTDFARSKRQEKGIIAFKDKIFSAETFLNPAKLFNLYATLQASIDTDISQEEFDDFIRLAQNQKNAVIRSVVLDYGDSKLGKPGLLMNPPVGSEFKNQWIIIPRTGNGNFSEVQAYVACELKNETCIISKEPLE